MIIFEVGLPLRHKLTVFVIDGSLIFILVLEAKVIIQRNPDLLGHQPIILCPIVVLPRHVRPHIICLGVSFVPCWTFKSVCAPEEFLL